MTAFTYDPSTAVGRVRLLAGDTDPGGLNLSGGSRTRTDAEISVLLSAAGGDVYRAAAGLLESRAAEFASEAGLTRQGGLTIDLRQRSMRLLQAARALRAQCDGPVLSGHAAVHDSDWME